MEGVQGLVVEIQAGMAANLKVVVALLPAAVLDHWYHHLLHLEVVEELVQMVEGGLKAVPVRHQRALKKPHNFEIDRKE